jgi:hypothetical protein
MTIDLVKHLHPALPNLHEHDAQEDRASPFPDSGYRR